MFDGADFRVFAQACANQNAGEPADRTAIGRSYYAAFLVAREYLKIQHAITKSRRGPHEQIYTHLMGLDPEIGKEYNRLRHLRERADYDLYYNQASIDVQDALDMSSRVISFCS